MFGLFDSPEKKMRTSAEHWLETAEKVYHHRRDQLAPADLAVLEKGMAELRFKLKERAEAAKLKLSIEALEPVLRRTGGKIYPKGELAEWVEFFLVAGIVLLGLRTYFVTNFQIPTNSMWPSYHGMKAQIYSSPREAPGPLYRAIRFLTLGAQHREAIAPQAGEIAADFFYEPRHQLFWLAYKEKHARKWLVFPSTVHEFTFYVADTPVNIDVPADFDSEFRDMVVEVFAHGDKALFNRQLLSQARAGHAENVVVQIIPGENDALRTATRIGLGKTVATGEPVLDFDILAGDMLFVDRFSYHFFRPKPGDGFVFRTGNIPEIGEDQYFIKRLAGVPGDTLEIRQPVLYRNGHPITGSAAYEKEFHQLENYPGYRNQSPDDIEPMTYLAKPGDTVTVPRGNYFALGDNSANSRDSRYWGFVPASEVVGRPLFVYYPFTRRWGPAH
ncbi:MAG TPA: signal peptidase I [Opitutaceae bacterium]|nr:signal peptidase I [Opitutaceae bacterium]